MSSFKSIKTQYIMYWTQQLATLLNAHLPLLQALELLAQTHTKKNLKQLTWQLYQRISEGQALSTALNYYPKIFDKTYRQLIYAAEQTGALSPILQKIAEQQLFRHKLRQQLIKTLIYPCLVLCVGFGVFILLLTWVVPQLAQVFAQFSQTLPAFTQFILNCADFLQRYMYYFLLSFLSVSCGLYVAYKYSPSMNLLISKIFWYSPIIGYLLQRAGCVLFLRTLSLLLSSGIPIASALPITLQVLNNLYVQQRLQLTSLFINQGHSFNYALQKAKLFPALVLQMCKIGEHTGQLHILLQDCAVYYQQQLDTLTQQLLQLIEPGLLIFLGLLIGSVVIAMYLPLFRLGLVMGG